MKSRVGSFHKFRPVCLITPEVERNIYPSIIKGFVRGGKSHGHRATVCDAHYDLGRQADAILEILVRHAAGVAMVPVIPMVTPAYHVEVLQNSGIPVVCCIRPVPNVQVPLVSWDFGKRMARACQILLERGHRRFGYFASFKYSLPEHHVRIIRETISGSGAELLDHNINYGSRLGVLEEADKLASLKRILRAKDRPTGIICNDATEAELVYVLAGQLGFEIPAELSIVGLGGFMTRG